MESSTLISNTSEASEPSERYLFAFRRWRRKKAVVFINQFLVTFVTETNLFSKMAVQNVKPISLKEEYDKPTGIIPEDIKKLREWLYTRPHLPEKHITELDLILAYHSCECSSGLTKEILDLNFTLRTMFPFLKDRKVEKTIQTLNDVLLCPLPMRTKEGYKMHYSRLFSKDPKLFIFSEVIRAFFMIIDIHQYEEGTWPGFLFVIDYADVCLGHLAQIDLHNLQQSMYFLQEAMLVRLKEIHFINAPSFVDKILLMIRPFLKKELMDMIHIHTAGSTKLQNFIPIEALPKEAGGSYKSIHECKEDIQRKLRDHEFLFKTDKNRIVTENLRPGKPKTITDIFGGVEGSFKKLDID